MDYEDDDSRYPPQEIAMSAPSLERIDDPFIAFWHKPEGTKHYHFYGANGHAKCGKWTLVGLGFPQDATQRRPRSACKVCRKKLDTL